MIGYSNLAKYLHEWKRDKIYIELKTLHDRNELTLEKILFYLKRPSSYNPIAKKNYEILTPYLGKEQNAEIANLQEKAVEWLFNHYS